MAEYQILILPEQKLFPYEVYYKGDLIYSVPTLFEGKRKIKKHKKRLVKKARYEERLKQLYPKYPIVYEE